MVSRRSCCRSNYTRGSVSALSPGTTNVIATFGNITEIREIIVGKGSTHIITGDPPEKKWIQTFGGARDDRAHSVQQTEDGGFIITGETSSFGAGGLDAWLIKIDSMGNEKWSRTFGDMADDTARLVQQINDQGFIMAGYTNSFGAGRSDAWFIRVAPEVVAVIAEELEEEPISRILIFGVILIILIIGLFVGYLLLRNRRHLRESQI